ncbi:type I-B CRISPR-associated protein Cas7/Csh2 [Salicibibacter kimchii]|uniref:Type I-B CRISPR-associated protein Cas7/Csh2 n=1 Tax=Salicibibacter kimchii TaxID=2099786 RepID=A0A345C1I5_9BACI|nr:type I-B CRISPR-associated protein Cas7/Csh2 [Salicibibacter kimchii]AXF57066.1 type I-B CRISPR-associated protein Cas7/Csh2 [Salicibibacter kimchii]
MNNSEILFLYDAKLTNPNGDIDDENRPRMDYERSINLVSDVRLKRYLRDYFINKELEVYAGQVDGKTVNATKRLENLFEKYDEKINLTKLPEPAKQWMLDQLIDVRLFGATMPIKSEGSKGGSLTYTGPVQFNWGHSLNKVSLVESSSITSHFSSSDANERGSIGKDYRLYYSLIAFHGLISAKRAEHTRLADQDVQLLDEAIVRSIPLQATRSKVGQYPRLYLRVEYNNPEFISGDLRDYLRLEEQEGLRSVAETKVNIDLLVDKLVQVSDQIEKIHIWHDPALELEHKEETKPLTELLPPTLQEKVNSLEGAKV